VSDDLSTIQQRRLELPEPPAVTFVLEVVEGPDHGARFVVDPSAAGPVLVGQSPACAFRLTDREVSRRHASVDVENERLRVTDLRSTNGTLVDGTAIIDAWVRPGQVLRLGATAIRVATGHAGASSVPAGPTTGFGRMIGTSFEMRRLYPLLERLAVSPLPLLVEGETGAGKELLAESLHDLGPRRAMPFVVFDCTAVPPGQLESELFGGESRPGLFVQANGGTLFLDEIGELDLAMQPKLLRVLERGEVTAVGSNRPIRIDVRVIASTQHDLDLAIQEGRFREDLFHRIVVTRVALPPLRKRRGDVEILTAHFLRELGAGAPPPALLSRWLDHAWPGNVRELKNAVARLVTLGEAGLAMDAAVSTREPAPLDASATVADFVDRALAADVPLARARQEIVRTYDARYVEGILAKYGGVVTRAAAAAGVERRYLQILRAKSKR
jgi:DNA-binding NtrC family response regulator